ncbi:MAG: Ig-like domain-containing protein [Firmicutes bacterium]|nr:Ig-like domain-containing protein [Bacillota bacterium]
MQVRTALPANRITSIFSIAVKLKLIILPATFILALLLLPSTALADQIMLNGNFEKNLSGWKLTKAYQGISVGRDISGYSDSGSLRFSTAGRRGKGEAYLTKRTALLVTAGSRAKVEFAFKKNWFGITPLKQKAYVNLIKPDGTAVNIWTDEWVSNDNVWTVQSLDITQYIDQTGIYAIRTGAAAENGNMPDAQTLVWFDNVSFDVLTLDSKPHTVILNPTGIGNISGDSCSISGIAQDDLGVGSVEVAILRTYDNTWWNGSSWVKDEVWNPASIISGAGSPSATWSYPWSLPTSDGQGFQIFARATDVTGNREVMGAQDAIAVDNVCPIGNIYIENAAAYTNKKEVNVNIDITGATQMRFSPDDGKTWTNWEPFAPVKTVTLPGGDGEKIVSAQFKDDTQNTYRASDSITLDTKPPVTKHIFPSPNATKVLPGSSIGVVFYEAMDSSSFKNDGTKQGSTFYIMQSSRWIAADLSYDAKSKTAKLVPRERLDEGTNYRVYLTKGIKDIAGNSLAASYSWEFTTSGSYKATFKGSVGKSGGTLGGGNLSVSIEIPEGALSQDTEITIDELREDQEVPSTNGLIRYSPVYKFIPKDLTFSVPVMLTMKYRRDEMPDPTTLRLVFYNEQEKKWKPIGNARIDLVNNQIMAPVTNLTMVTIIAANDLVAPTTAILTPTGASDISGSSCTIYGFSNDNAGVVSVEVSIVDKSNNTYWNGGEWQSEETWVKADITKGKGSKEATWSYHWVFAQKKRGNYEIRAQATDNGGNVEASPVVIPVRVVD